MQDHMDVIPRLIKQMQEMIHISVHHAKYEIETRSVVTIITKDGTRTTDAPLLAAVTAFAVPVVTPSSAVDEFEELDVGETMTELVGRIVVVESC